MRLNVTVEQLRSIPSPLLENISKISGVLHLYKSDFGEFQKSMHCGRLLDVLNRHINKNYHVYSMYQEGREWVIESVNYKVRKKELVDALWTAVLYSYDNESRLKEIREKEKKWEKSHEESAMVTVKNIG